ncbi:hypothetical protein GRJ2_000167900 [Grus japonensis]|uniref:Uncharacterized protein n=1 Tax=Grus japonensis TaxID=30415 RepID=A0ABC9VWY0_GRUJA
MGLAGEPKPAGSKTDPPLAKAEPLSDSGSTSEITELRRGRKTAQHQEQLQPERGGRRCEKNNSADTKVSEEGGGGDAPGAGAEIPLQPVEKTMVRQAVPLQPMEVDVEDPMPEQMETPEGGCDPVAILSWSRLLAGPVAPWREEPMLEQVCWQDL